MDNIIVDLDGTLADIGHRLHLMQAKDWAGGNALIPEDGVHEEVANLVRHLSMTHTIIVISSRSENTREATRQWMRERDIYPELIILRPNNNYQPDHELKLSQLIEHFGSIEEAREKVWFILEDRAKVVEAYRNAGLKVFQVRESEY